MLKYHPDIVWKDINSLIPYVSNTKKHPDSQIDKLAGAIAEFGFDQPIVVDGDGVIIKGHGRLLASKKLQLNQVPVLVRTDLTPAQVKAARISDNRIAESEWDEELLKIELIDLKASGFNLELTGFDAKELGFLIDTKASDVIEDDIDAIVDKIEECQQKWQVKLGDMFSLGQHRILCGDSTKAEDVSKVLMADTPSLMVTDPPYGVEYDANWRNEAARDCKLMGNRRIGAGAVGKVENDDRADWSEAWKLFTGDVAYVWSAPGPLSVTVFNSLVESGFEIRMQMIWAKNNLVIGRGHYHAKHEPCWYAVRKGGTAHWIGDRKQTTLWEIDKPMKSETGHSTQKPIECMAKAIQNHESEFVYEPFSGSGTTLIACEQLGRKCLAIELNPAYVAIALERWSTITNQQPVKL